MSALTITAILAAWCLLSLPVGILIGCSFRDRREFDDDLTALAVGVGVLPGVDVELDPNHRSPLYDHIAAVMAADVDREIYDYLEGRSA